MSFLAQRGFGPADQLTSGQKDSIAQHLIVEKYKAGMVIVNEGDMASSYYIIKDGEVEVKKDSTVVRVLKEGESFGEKALYEDGTRSMSVFASKDTTCIALSREDLIRILGAQIQDIILCNYGRWGFQNNKSLNSLSNLQIEKVLNIMKLVKVKKGETILCSGERYKDILVVVDVQLKVGELLVSKGTIWGEKYLFRENKNIE